MIPIFALLFTIALSLLVMRIGTLALMLTGVSREMARFQSRSAFTRDAYTTAESESITTHPVRRQIVMALMLLGNIGIAAGMATMMVSLMSTTQSGSQTNWRWNIGLLTVGLLVLWLFTASRWLESRLNRMITFGLTHWGHLEVRDYIALLQLRDGYAVTELQVAAQDWLADKTLLELKLPTEGLLVLGIQCAGGGYIGAPRASTKISVGDTIVLYGPIHRVEELDQRCRGSQGDVAHEDAVNEHEDSLEGQEEMAN